MSAPVINPRYELLDDAVASDLPPYQYAKVRDRVESRVVTLQIVPASALSGAARSAFGAAVQAAQTLDHPGILRVYDQGVTEDTGDLYVVREALRGITLQERIRRIAPFTLAVAADIAQSVAEALAAAHRAGVVHGDLRPGHVLLSPEGQIKTADFAYGAVVSAAVGDAGRAAFLAPELSPGTATEAGDIYALGALLYEMLTGVPPLAGTTRVTAPRDVNPGVPPALDGVVRKALAADPAARYRTADALVADLGTVRDCLRAGKPLDWLPGADRPEKPGEKPAERRLPRPPVAAASVPLAAAAGDEDLPGGVVPHGILTDAAQDLDDERHGGRGAGRNGEAPMRVREPSPVLGRLAAGLFVLAILSVIGLVWYATKFLEVPSDIQVPSLIGKTFDDAKRIAGQQHFTLVESPSSDYSDTMPENQVYQQSPLPGHTIKADKEVTVYRSLGPRLLTVPLLVGTTQDYAGNALQQANLPLGSVVQEYSETVPSGVVIRQSPDKGSKVARNTAVNFVVSRGKQPPDAPTDVSGTASGTDRAELSWHAMPRAESYTILRSLDGDTTTVARGLAQTRFTDTNLKPETTYSYTINAVNSAGESGPSESALVTTQAKVETPLALPPDTVVTPPDVPAPESNAPPPDAPRTTRLRPFTIEVPIPRRPRRPRHVQVEIQDVTGSNLVYDENQEPGERVSVPVQAFGNKITFRIFLDGKLVEQNTR